MIIDGFHHQIPDNDPEETDEWLDSLDSVIKGDGQGRARYLMTRLIAHARSQNVEVPASISTPYINTIPPDHEAPYPGDEEIESRIRRINRWNAAIMVIRANKAAEGIGGHLSTFASSAMLYEVGFDHFFRGKEGGDPGDHVYIQGHAAPGIYARAFMEYRLDEAALDNFRREIGGGLTSYPHPKLMPDFWEYPTVSMGLGPINSIYHARFLKYMQNRGIDDTSQSRVWSFIGDGETDEPETLGSISLASREALDNLVWVINCNLQRLDGPVRGNGKIIQELEAVFRGAGWNVIKVIWGSNWDPLLARDPDGALVNKMNATVDGEYQRYKAEDGAYVREHFFGPDERLRDLVAHLSDEEVWALRRGGLDYRKVYAAYAAATQAEGVPTVILAKTIKGWQLGPGIQGGNTTHQVKKLTPDQLIELRNRLQLQDDIPDDVLANGGLPFFRPPEDSPEVSYLHERRRALDGPLPSRQVVLRTPLPMPDDKAFAEFDVGSGANEVSTTGAFTRLLRSLTRDEHFGRYVVPIIPDEGRTFGMDALFKELGIYSSKGQLYEPVDHHLVLSYKEGIDGQILEEGITEAGATASWLAAATAYATRGVAMVPFYSFYSMFGFQRVGDQLWMAGDAGARGFLLGATAGRTTLHGEGLQHQDGHSLLLASSVPACEAYDPAFAYEMSTIIRHGLRRMYVDGDDVFYYLTLYNEGYVQPPKPAESDAGILGGLYKWSGSPVEHSGRATILFSGSAHTAARQAQADLAEHYGIGADLWSATSYKRLREEALTVERWNRLHPGEERMVPYVTRTLQDSPGPFVAVTDYMKAVSDQVARWIPGGFYPLGTDGYGRSDTRTALRRFFEVDTGHVVVAVLSALASEGKIGSEVVKDAIARYDIDTESIDPRLR
jgi:pyruvate dehydrogenase E1 component